MANRLFQNRGHFYMMETKPVLLTCNFIVDSTNGNGLGLRSLKGTGFKSVFMNTSPASASSASVFALGAFSVVVASNAGIYVGQAVTDSTTGGNITGGTLVTSVNGNTIGLSKATAGASAVSPGDTLNFVFSTAAPGNPNPAGGIIQVQLMDNYTRYLAGFSGFVSPLSGSNLTSVTSGLAYVIVSLGTTTLAQWVAKGLPAGLTPAVGMSFIATATGALGGTGAVQTATHSGVFSIEVVGDPNQAIANAQSAVNGGAYFILKCEGAKALSFTGTTNTSTAVTAVSSTVGLVVGQLISGTGIPLGTTIAAIPSSSTLTLSQAATASATVAMVATPATGLVAPANGSVVSLSFLLSDSSVQVQGE